VSFWSTIAILSVTNWTDHNLTFIDTESSRGNNHIAPHTSELIGGPWVPWCAKASDFPVDHFRTVDDDTDKTPVVNLAAEPPRDGDLIRSSSTGWEDRGSPNTGKHGPSGPATHRYPRRASPRECRLIASNGVSPLLGCR
jgi:hypothetical protein